MTVFYRMFLTVLPSILVDFSLILNSSYRLLQMRNSEDVKMVEKDIIVRADAFSPYQWGLDRVDQRDETLDLESPSFLGKYNYL